MSMTWILVTDGNKDFHALTDEPNAAVDEHVTAFVYFPDQDNGFGQPDGVHPISVKKLGDGKFGS